MPMRRDDMKDTDTGMERWATAEGLSEHKHRHHQSGSHGQGGC